MVREKIAPEYLENEREYESDHWEHFQRLRAVARPVLEALRTLSPLLHGSIARGDISKTSDIDVIIPYQVSEFQINVAMNAINYEPAERWLVQATPLSAIKGVIVFSTSPELTITFPLIPFYPREHEFYHFGGALGFDDLAQDINIRVPGVDKQLLFIEPTEKGHEEYRVTTDNANLIAKILNISIDTILERIRVLERRNEKGRTGIFKKRLVKPSEAFGAVLKEIAETDPASRRRIKRKKI
ncbi:MAG: nucleotidyltransferase domain-containing protein [Candidatus Helarchaeota archaeon]|nr:nucleotidyltransferase domain-containing protein [Candidatus Helarchaeota archaeon]